MAGEAPGSDVDADLTLAVRLDPDRLAAGHPSRRLFRAHPALGLEETENSLIGRVSLEELGLRWLTLEPAEQRAREADFLRGLLERAAEHAARFEAAHPGDDAATVALAECGGAAATIDATVRGPLTAETIDALVAHVPKMLLVEAGSAWTLVTSAGFEGLGVWIDSYRAAGLERELEAAWWDAATERERRGGGEDVATNRRRAADRELRARVLLSWRRRAWLLAGGALLATEQLDWQPLGWLGTSIAILVVALAILIPLDRLAERWYRRAAQR
jgi:hypothetical protein